MFPPVDKKSFPERELDVLRFWREHETYHKSLAARSAAPPFVFYEGPPTANGMPHPGHCLTRAVKDLFPRYKTMRGYLCERKAGWDTHGLPVETEVAKDLTKELGRPVHSKEDIEAYGIEKFIHRCQASVWRYMQEWRNLTERIGFWVDLENAYVTYHQSYVESVWWSLKQLFERGLLYKGHKIVWWWAQGGTALSAGEVGQGYRQVADPSVYVKFPLLNNDGDVTDTSLLVWTTTPWTLPSNQFAAINPGIEYSTIEIRGVPEKIVVASDLVEQIVSRLKKPGSGQSAITGALRSAIRPAIPLTGAVPEYSVIRKMAGTELVGLRYQPPFDCFRGQSDTWGLTLPVAGTPDDLRQEQLAWRVVGADFVTTDSGTGIVHIAPAFGEDDFNVLTQEQQRFTPIRGKLERDAAWKPELINCVGPDGKFTQEAPEYLRGRWVKDCDKDIIRDLKQRGLLFHQEQYLHDYPFCWRAEEDPLIQYPRESWFIRTTAFRDAMLENNSHINWMPEHIKDGRFGKFLESNVDWALSRERFWGTPLPIWVCDQCGHMEAVESYDALLAKDGVLGTESWDRAKAAHAELPEDLKVHKPYIDDVRYACPQCAAQNPPPSKGREQPSTVASGDRAQGGSPPLGQSGGTANRGAGAGAVPKASVGNPSPGPSLPGRGGLMQRVSEVIDCWYDSGAMPFAQWGYRGDELKTANENPDHQSGQMGKAEWGMGNNPPIPIPHSPFHSFHTHFPADFISEAIDQTRGWFYSQLAISTMLWGEEARGARREGGRRGGSVPSPKSQVEKRASTTWELGPGTWDHSFSYPHPFRNCIVLGLMLGEDGQKMSKSKRNYREPAEIFDRYGADALRWYFFANQPPWTSIRYSEQAIKDSVPEFLLRLWNVYSFFTIYANIDGFDPGGAVSHRLSALGQKDVVTLAAGAFVGADGSRPLKERSELDRWILSELHRTAARVVERMDQYDNFAACGAITEFVDALSNWYVRRSRDRFWAADKRSPEKLDAYWTLYECLVTTAKLIAPFTPFLAESLWQNLAADAGVFGERVHESVHLADFPTGNAAAIDEQLSTRMNLVRHIASLGRQARTAANLKVRQPLARVEVILADTTHQAWLEEHASVIADELNVKLVEFSDQPDKYVTHDVLPNFKLLGPKLGKVLPKLKQWLAAQSGADLLANIRDNGQIDATIDGQAVALGPDEVEVRIQAKPGWAAANDKGVVVVLATELTPELVAEGLARDFVRVVQDRRKEMGCEFTDRIEIGVVTESAELRKAIEQFRDYIVSETLATMLTFEPIPGAEPIDVKVGDHDATLYFRIVRQ